MKILNWLRRRRIYKFVTENRADWYALTIIYLLAKIAGVTD